MKPNLSALFLKRSTYFGALALLVACGGGGDSNSVIDPAAAPPAAPGASGAPGATPPASTASMLTMQLPLTGNQEIPPTGSAATGTGVVTVDPVTRQFTAVATTQGMAGVAAHVHEGIAGVSGPIIFPMTETPAGSGVWRTSVQLTEAQMAALLAERYYINVHSAAFPNGEIRGQIPEES